MRLSLLGVPWLGADPGGLWRLVPRWLLPDVVGGSQALLNERLVAEAAELAEQEALRGYDAVHLAAALLVEARVLTSADADLCEAATRRGIHVANPLDRSLVNHRGCQRRQAAGLTHGFRWLIAHPARGSTANFSEARATGLRPCGLAIGLSALSADQ